MSTRRNTGLSAGARGTAALLCVLMALTDIGWIIRDLNIAQHPADLWWTWLGEVRRPGEFTAWATSALDPLLVLGALAAAAAALRAASSIATGALLALASATALLRLPLLWVLGAGWLQGLQSGLTGRARLTAGAQLALAVVLAVVVAAGRRPDDSADEDLRGVTRRAYGVVHRLPDDEPDDAPGRPYKGQAGALAALLGTAGPALAAWEVHWVLRLGWDVYRKGLLGDASAFRALLQPPVHWQMTACALLSLGAAVAALRRASWARPAALAAGALLAVQGAGVLVFAAGTGQLGQFPLLPGQAQLELGTAVVVALAGAAAAVVAARPGVPDSRPEAGGALAYDASPEAERPPHAPPPPSRLPPGW
ncbi:hypothetical protein [Streptomyces natalensis]|uniref:Uncharacterized protein n=1 Tax=Streptomyces natalensis ATCC 27448 TaxID=1240678 RepID=A0A0D7CEG4_9ACTN|nr:hypothetical protein [Streptomyces natalensis]KIZ14270.1 hypothetical protein SNA_34765 [Streptomyces natalensis ATCC 27448]